MTGSASDEPSAASGLTATLTPRTGRPTQTPSPGPAASISLSEMSVTGSASVMPYGVCASACGSTSRTARSRAAGTGAPADISSRTPPSAARCSSVRSGRGRHDVAQRRR